MLKRQGRGLLAIFGTMVVAAAIVLVSAPTPSSANWFGASGRHGDCDGGIITDNKDVSFNYVDASADLSAATNWVRTNLLNPTALNTSYASHTDTTDVIMRDRYYSEWCEDLFGVEWTTDGRNGLRGVATCYRITTGNRCQQQVVRISTRFFDAHGATGDRWIVCHEVGHAIGLRHRSAVAGCMFNRSDTSTVAYTAHDRAHFSANWATEPASGTE